MPSVSVGTCESTEVPIELFYDIFGDSMNEPMLLIPGLGMQMLMWTPEWCQRLVGEGFYVIRMDNRDVGLSTHLDDVHRPSMLFNHVKGMIKLPPHFAYTLEDMAKDVVGLLDALKLDAVHLIGASIGGMVAQILAIQHPKRVRSMCCIMSTTSEPGLKRPKFGVIWQLSKSTPKDRSKAIEHILDTLKVMSSKEYYDRDKFRPYAEEVYDRSHKYKGVGRQMAAILAGSGRRKALNGVKLPCLVIHGREDPLIPFEHAEDLYSALSNCSLSTPLHMCHDLPEEVYPMMLEAVIKNTRRPVK